MLNLHDIALCRQRGNVGLIMEITSENGEVLYKGVHILGEKMGDSWESKKPTRIISSTDLLRAHQYDVITLPEASASLIRMKSGTLPEKDATIRNTKSTS